MNKINKSITCAGYELDKTNKTRGIFALLGISVLIAALFMVFVFIFERLSIIPTLALIYIDSLTSAENDLLFAGMIILIFFLISLSMWGLYRIIHYKECRK